ncbi:DUF6044 family protein [Niallia taxi]|nr:DUF6044 family protein [Niallia taxi]MDE5052579.1 DUF6044 family protein [Niallia taxi]
MFTDELGKLYVYEDLEKQLNHFELNMEPFGEMGGSYLFSAVPITNAADNHLQQRKLFGKFICIELYIYYSRNVH